MLQYGTMIAAYFLGFPKKAEEYFSESLHGTQNDYLIFSEKTGADFWLAILNCMGGNYGLAEEILSKSGGGAGIEMLRKIHGGEAGLKEICAAEGLALFTAFFAFPGSGNAGFLTFRPKEDRPSKIQTAGFC